MTAATFGRPTLLSTNWRVPLPLAIDDESLSEKGEGVQPPGAPSQLDAFVHSLRFFDLLSDVLNIFYMPSEAQSRSHQSPATQPSSSLSTTIALNSRLDGFLGKLPPHLQLHRESNLSEIPITEIFELQARTLHLRSLYLRILLLRPYVLSRIQHTCNKDLTTNSNTSGLEQRISSELIQLCLSTAHAIINNLYDEIHGPRPSTSWHAVFCKTMKIFRFLSAELELDSSYKVIVLTLYPSCLRCCYNCRGSITLSRTRRTDFLRSSKLVLG